MRLLTGSARLAGVIGWPVAHSRSPRIHGTWLARHRIDGAYLPLAVAPADFAEVVRGLAKAGFAGVNMTIPHKQAAFAICDELAETAADAGAVNTLVFRDGKILGANTDGVGFIENLRAHGAALGGAALIPGAGGAALILGAGGAARAIGAALRRKNIAVTYCNRTPARAAALGQALPWAHRAAALRDFSLLVNTTSLGMAGQPALEMKLDHARDDLVVADIVYAPLETPLLAAARARGLPAVEGLGMLLHQAVPGFASWFGVTPVVDAELYRIVAEEPRCS